MYLSHFGLNQLPFGITPDPSFFFSGNKRGEILAALLYAIEQGDGIVKVTGEVGSGKTMLCRMLDYRLPDHIDVIYLVNPTLTREQVIFAIAGELDLPLDGKRVDQIIRMLHAALIERHIKGRQVVLLVEEAQAMSLDTLEEIRLFSNLETAHHKLLQIVLFGQPELDAHLHLTSMRQLRERITNSFKVPPLAPANVPDYLKFRVRAAGYHGPDLFDQSATKLLSTVSEGIIRRISILADKSLLAAFADNANTVSAKHVKAAIQDSEFPRFPRKWLVRQATFATVALLVVATLGWNLHQSPGFASIPATAATKRVLAKAPAAMPAKSVAVANPVSVPSPVATPAPVKTISAVTAAAPKPEKVEQRLLDSTNWLHQQPADRYSLQVAMIATDNQDQLTSTLRKMESEMGLQNVYIYAARKSNPSSSSDLPHFGILVGSYANRADAIKMLDQLATQWGYKAQLRTIGGINKEINGI